MFDTPENRLYIDNLINNINQQNMEYISNNTIIMPVWIGGGYTVGTVVKLGSGYYLGPADLSSVNNYNTALKNSGLSVLGLYSKSTGNLLQHVIQGRYNSRQIVKTGSSSVSFADVPSSFADSTRSHSGISPFYKLPSLNSDGYSQWYRYFRFYDSTKECKVFLDTIQGSWRTDGTFLYLDFTVNYKCYYTFDSGLIETVNTCCLAECFGITE